MKDDNDLGLKMHPNFQKSQIYLKNIRIEYTTH